MMTVSNVSNEDGQLCAMLIKVMSSGRWNGMSDKDAEVLLRVKKWVHDLALEMAQQLKATPSTPVQASVSAEGFKVKAMGPLGPPKSKKRK